MLKDLVGKGRSEVLEASVQHVRLEMKETRRSMKTIPLDPYQMETKYTVLSAELSNKWIEKKGPINGNAIQELDNHTEIIREKSIVGLTQYRHLRVIVTLGVPSLNKHVFLSKKSPAYFQGETFYAS